MTRLTRTGNLSLTELALDLGFYDYPHFSKQITDVLRPLCSQLLHICRHRRFVQPPCNFPLVEGAKVTGVVAHGASHVA